MIKRVSLVRPREGMGRAEFLEHWMGPHAEIVRELPGLRGLRLGVVSEWSPSDRPWVGVGEVWFETPQAARDAFASEPHRSRLVADRRLFLGDSEWCFVEEHTVIAPPDPRS